MHDADYSIDYYLCYRKLHDRVILQLVQCIILIIIMIIAIIIIAIIIIINKFIGNSTELDSYIQYIQAYKIQGNKMRSYVIRNVIYTNIFAK